MAHGGSNTLGLPAGAVTPAAGGPGVEPLDPTRFPGFSYFLKDPPTEEPRGRLGENRSGARELLTALYNALPIIDQSNSENPGIPAGYTYLLQFMAHDMVESTVPAWAAAEAGIEARNMRAGRLQLDALYGGGPTTCPMVFEPGPLPADFRARLRLGTVEPEKNQAPMPGRCPFRDVARVNMQPVGAPTDAKDPTTLKDRTVLIADPRNDDTLILTQLVVLFTILHNGIVDKLKHVGAPASFALARAALLGAYHAVIRHDVLPRLLHSGVWSVLGNPPQNNANWLWDGQNIPLEFSHGAFRFGHSMVRGHYKFNKGNIIPFSLQEILTGPLPGSVARRPLPSSWVVMWSHFFVFDGLTTPNMSRKLQVGKDAPLDEYKVLPDAALDTPPHVSIRDWLSAARARMWRPDKLIEAIKEKYNMINFLTNTQVIDWLTSIATTQPATSARQTIANNVNLLADDLPLPLYVLLEAQLDPIANRKTLGPLGSVIVGEVVCRCLEDANPDPLLDRAFRALGPDADRIRNITTMPQLIALAEDWGDLGDCELAPFIE